MIHGWSIRLAGLAPAGLVAACLAAPADDGPLEAMPASAVLASAARTPIDWTQGDCLSQLRTLQQAAGDGRLTADDPPPFALELVPAAGSWLDAVPELPIEADLPLAPDSTPSAAGCVIRIGPARDLRAAQRAVDVQDVSSAYQSATRNERNPDYDAAQRELREAKEHAKGRQEVVEVDDPLLDLIGTTVGGLIGTIDRRSRRQEVDAADAQLAATPRSLAQPVYRPYRFERVVVRAQKQAVVPVALLDGRGRLLRSAELRQSERRELFVLHGLDSRDRDYEQHRATSMTRADLARWARTPPVLSLSSVAAALTEQGPVLASKAGAAELEPWPDAPALGDDPLFEEVFADKDRYRESSPDDRPGDQDLGPRPVGFEVALAPGATHRAVPPDASVVAIRAGSSAGNGFYVREDLVLTTHELVGAVSVVDVTTADGATVPALVAAVDPVRNLALLQVPRPGPVIALYRGALAPEQLAGADGGPGRPVLSDGQVAGMTTGVAGQQGGIVSVDAIRTFLDGQAGALAAIP
jgi:Trypsin-like peptidase domain